MKKIGALVLAVIMMMTVTAFAVELNNGEVGGSDVFATDNPTDQGKSINLLKELKVYNLDETSIKAPTISYTYTLTAGEAGVSITDAATDHENNTAVTVQTKAGLIPGVTVTGSTNGTPHTSGATAADGATSVSDTIEWTTDTSLTASTDGTANTQKLNINFTNIVFGAAGVYRYVITETLTSGYTYDNTGVTETTSTVNKHIRYLDVYVKPATTITSNGTIAADWEIYGYVCVLKNETITDADDTATTGAVKTNGFVSGKNGETNYLADQYYTYNTTISKAVVNDAYAAATHAFPFTVIFTNSDITHNTLLNTTISGTVTNTLGTTAGAPTWNGIVSIKDQSSIKYIGIPMGTDIEVYETNDMAGVTYAVETRRTNCTTETATDQAVISGSTPTSAVTQGNNRAYEQSTKSVIDTQKNADDDNTHSVAVTNTLQVISPTGVVLRVAPYTLMLAAGIILVVLAMKRRKANVAE